jgi:hypothetical protein
MARTKCTPNLTLAPTSAPDSIAVFSTKTLAILQQAKENTKNEAAATRVEKSSAHKKRKRKVATGKGSKFYSPKIVN